jgi:hypothetical protein
VATIEPALGASLSSAVYRGVKFLRTSQRSDGEFQTFMARDPSLERRRQFDSSPFVTTFVLHALSLVEQPDVAATIQQGLAFLRSEQHGPGVWRYWSTRNPNHLRVLPDLDDTACASWTLRRHGIPFAPNEQVLYANRNRAGLFYTFLQPARHKRAWLELLRRWNLANPCTWLQLLYFKRDVDIAVNANVLLYLGENDHTRAAGRLLLGLIERHAEDRSGFYFDPLATYYMISRAYFYGVSSLEPTAEIIPRRIAERHDDYGTFKHPLIAALTAACLLNYGLLDHAHVGGALRQIIASQRPDGSWPKAALYCGSFRRCWFGSEELTTALCVEALVRYRMGAPRTCS